MTVLSALLVPAFLGFLTLAALLRNTPLRHKGLFLASASIPTGLGLCSLILFVSLLIAPLHVRPLSVAASLGLTVLMFFFWDGFRFKKLGSALRSKLPARGLDGRNKSSLLKQTLALAGALLFLYTAFTMIHFYFLSVSTNIFGGWDARYFWSLKAKFMFRDPSDWQLMFSSKLPWSNQGYPLLWPGTLAWGWHWLGQESPLWGPFAALSFYVPCVLLVVWHLASQRSFATGWIGGSFAFVLLPPLFWAIHQYADVPLTFFMTACVLIGIAGLRTNEPGLLGVSGLMGGLAAWTKNEGILFVLWIFLLLGTTLPRHFGKNMPAVVKSLKIFILGVLGPLLAVGLLKYLSRDAGVSAQDLPPLTEILSSAAERSGTILKAFYDHMSPGAAWKGLWGFFVLAGLFLGFKRKRDPYEWLLWGIVLLINAGYFAVLLTTSPDLPWQITTALDRLLIHSSFLAVVFVFEMLTPYERSSPLQ